MIPKKSTKGLAGMPYFGSKSIRSANPTGRWITSLLPYREWYVEPFAGMLGVLLQRNPSKIELVSDINGDLINWWTIIRDRPEELRDLLNKSPLWSRALWHQSAEMVNKEKDPLKRAYWWTIMLNWSYGSTGKWIKDFYRHGAKKPTRIEERFNALAERLKNVQLETYDAVQIMENVAKRDIVAYLDPPYDVECRDIAYHHNYYDVEALTNAVLKQKGLVAISGYGSEWDHLGWHRYELETIENFSPQRGKRTEVLWTNWEINE